MVTHSPAIFEAIADPTRRAILDALSRGELSAGALAARFPISRPAVSRHLRVLRGAGLIRQRQEARSRIYSLDAEPLRDVAGWIDHYRVFWAARLQGLKRYAESRHQAAGGKETT